MKKRVMSLLLVMLMVFSLLPAAFAVSDPVSEDAGDLHMDKTLIQQDDTYDIQLRSWSTGKYETSVEVVQTPTDFVLVLDVSDSMYQTENFMEDFYYEADPTLAKVNQDGIVHDNYYRTSHYYIKIGDEYKQLYLGGGFYTEDFHAYYLGDNGEHIRITENSTSSGKTVRECLSENYKDAEIYGLQETARRVVLERAVKAFLETVKTADNGQGIYRVAIVAYGTDAGIIENGSYKKSGYDAANALKSVNVSEDYTSLVQSADEIDAIKDGQTRPDKGLAIANEILANSNKKSVVLMFTDGEPKNGTSGDNTTNIQIANAAVAASYTLIHSHSATLYTVGLFSNDGGDTKKMSTASNATIADYMNATSSNCPDVTSCENLQSTDYKAHDYYTLVDDAESLSAAFEKVSQESTSTTSSVTANSTSVLKDVINEVNFSAANASVRSAVLEPMKLVGEEPNQHLEKDESRETVDFTGEVKFENGVLTATGFDYSAEENIITENGGYRLVVTLKGLVPLKSGTLDSNTSAGIYTPDDKPLIELDESPNELVEPLPYVIDFNAKMTLEKATLGNKIAENNGKFTQEGTVVAYQFNKKNISSGQANFVMNGVDSAMAFLTDAGEWKEIQAIPANNIYFDDALLSKTVDVGDGSGYNEGVTSSVAQAVKDVDDGAELLFTFKGTGIDVYCTTNADGGYVQAGLMTGAEKDPSKLVYFERTDGHFYKDGENYVHIDEQHPAPEGAKRYDSSLMAVRNYSITPAGEGNATLDRYNVPTVSYTGLPYGVYTVRIKTVDKANYKLDGIRVYNAMADDESVYAGTNEANARFYNLRAALVNDGRAVTVKKDDESQTMKAFLAGEEDASELLPGVLFIDNKDSVLRQKTRVDENGVVVRDQNGEPVKDLVYQDAFEAYVANGPKNEIYLAKGQGIAFNISTAARGDHYWVGLSIPDQGSTTPSVTVNDQTLKPSVASAVDMYYPITPRPDGTFVIVNHGDAMIAVTNLKVTTDPVEAPAADPDDFPAAAPFALLSTEAMDLAANSSEALSQDDGGNQGMQELIRQLISSFVRALFNNISRLFGK